jgi:hypothetical protein
LSSDRLTCPRHVSFSEGRGIMRAGVAIVNDRLEPGGRDARQNPKLVPA